MRSEVMYRDLPGGPLVVKFADEVSLWCLCSKCGMYSKDMYQDSASHVFCSVCIFECSARKMIHCKHERKDVPVDDMVQAVDVGHVMSDQIVFCPNSQDGSKCKEFCALKDLEGHYLECAATKINCLSCGREVKGVDWEHHVKSCVQKVVQCRYCVLAIPRSNLQAHEEQCYDNPHASPQPKNTTPVLDSNNSCSKPPPCVESKANFNNLAGSGGRIIEAQPSRNDVDFDGSLLQCIYCNRNVKRKNIGRHYEMCAQNKTRSAVSTVGNSTGNIETLSSWTHLEYGDLPPADASPLPPDIDEMAEEAQPNSSIVQYGAGVAAAACSLPYGIFSGIAELLSSAWGSDSATTETPQDSDTVPELASCSSPENRPPGCPPPWPAQPSYRKMSEWFDEFDALLESNGIRNEDMKFPVLLNKMPTSFAYTFLELKNQRYPYTAVKSAVLNFVQKVWTKTNGRCLNDTV